MHPRHRTTCLGRKAVAKLRQLAGRLTKTAKASPPLHSPRPGVRRNQRGTGEASCKSPSRRPTAAKSTLPSIPRRPASTAPCAVPDRPPLARGRRRRACRLPGPRTGRRRLQAAAPGLTEGKKRAGPPCGPGTVYSDLPPRHPGEPAKQETHHAKLSRCPAGGRHPPLAQPAAPPALSANPRPPQGVAGGIQHPTTSPPSGGGTRTKRAGCARCCRPPPTRPSTSPPGAGSTT